MSGKGFFGSLLGGGGGQEKDDKAAPPPVKLLVIQSDDYDWEAIFKGSTLPDGRSIEVKQTGWEELLVGPVDNYSKTKCIVSIRNLTNRTAEPEKTADLSVLKRRNITFSPDFVLVRNEVTAPPSHDYQNQLYALMYAGIPAVNSLSSIYSFMQKPIVQAELNKIMRRVGRDKFPLIEQDFYATHQTAMYGLPFPCVVKIGNAHAGTGKMRIKHHHDFEDFRTVLAMHHDYCTAEPFKEGDYDLRIQKIGDKIRAFKRVSVSGAWKTNTGSAHMEEIPMEDRYLLWATEAGKMFGGIDILSVDAIHTTSGEEYILEVNGCSSGLVPDVEQVDNLSIRDLVMERMMEEVPLPTPAGAPPAGGAPAESARS